MNILFVGDEPSKKNKDPKVAFDGTQSGKRLDEWIACLQEHIQFKALKINSNDKKALKEAAIPQRIVVALGRNASKRLRKLKINHFNLPHPSGRNRKLNDVEYVARCLGDLVIELFLLK